MISLSNARQLAIRFAPRTAAARSAMRLASGTVLGQLVMVAAAPVVARLYVPEDFSCLGLFLSFLNVAMVGATLTYESAIVSADTAEDAEYLLLACLAVSLPIAGAAAGVMYGLTTMGVLGFASLPSGAVYLIVPTIVLAAAIAATRQWLVREQQFALLSHSLVARAGGRCTTQIGFGAVGYGWPGLVLGEVVARVVGCWVCSKYVWPGVSQRLKQFRWTELFRVLGRYIRFPVFCLPSRLIDALALALPIPLVIGFYGAEVGGVFVLIQQVTRAPVTLLVKSTSDVFHQRMAQSVRRGGSSVKLIDRTVARLFCLGLLPTLLLALMAPRVVPFILGGAWSDAGLMAAALSPSLLAQFAVAPTSQAMSVYRAYHIKLIYDFVNIGAAVASVWICASLNCSALTAVYALSWSNASAFVLYYLLLRHVARTEHPDARNH